MTNLDLSIRNNTGVFLFLQKTVDRNNKMCGRFRYWM